MKQQVYELIKNNVNYLKKFQVTDHESLDFGAISDPILKRVVGDNYATEEYALAASFLSENQNRYRKSIENAMDFHLRTTAGYPGGQHTEHPQHRRLGFI